MPSPKNALTDDIESQEDRNSSQLSKCGAG
jgi:hypothetical protein